MEVLESKTVFKTITFSITFGDQPWENNCRVALPGTLMLWLCHKETCSTSFLDREGSLHAWRVKYCSWRTALVYVNYHQRKKWAGLHGNKLSRVGNKSPSFFREHQHNISSFTYVCWVHGEAASHNGLNIARNLVSGLPNHTCILSFISAIGWQFTLELIPYQG